MIVDLRVEYWTVVFQKAKSDVGQHIYGVRSMHLELLLIIIRRAYCFWYSCVAADGAAASTDLMNMLQGRIYFSIRIQMNDNHTYNSAKYTL